MNSDKLSLSEEVKLLRPAIGENYTSLRDLLNRAQDRGPLLLIFLLCIPFCLPIPLMGLSTPFGAAIIYFSMALIHHKAPRLPERWLNYPIEAQRLNHILDHTLKIIAPFEKIVHPYAAPLCEKLKLPAACVMIWLAALLSLPLPIPTTNVIPAVPIILISLGLLECNFIVLLIGLIMGIIASVIFTTILWTIWVLGKSGADWFKHIIQMFS